jgi:hypothetical protein
MDGVRAEAGVGRIADRGSEAVAEPPLEALQDSGTSTDSSGGAGEQAPSPGAARSRPRLTAAAAMAAAALVIFALSLAQSVTSLWDADTASVSLQGWDLVHGHLLLHGWWASDVNFYTFDAPIYGLCLAVLGFGDTALHVAGALIYTLVFLAAAWLAKGRAHGREAWLRVALTGFFLAAVLFRGALLGSVVLVPDHYGTTVFALITFVVVCRHAERRWAPWAVLAVLTLGQLGDATVRYVAVPSVLIVWFVDTLVTRRLRTPQSRLALAAAASLLGSTALRAVMKHFGAYYLTKPHTQIASVADWGWHVKGTWLSLLSLFGVQTSGFPGADAGTVAATVFGGFALLCGLAGMLYVLLRWTKVEVADRLLTVSTLVYLAAYAFSTVAVHGGGGGYEFVGVIALLATLTARTVPRLRLPGVNPGARGRGRIVVAGTVAAVLAAVVCLASGTGLFRDTQSSSSQQLAGWLKQHNLTYGLSGYWDAAPTTVYSGGAVQVRQILFVPGAFVPYAWGAKQQWYEESQHYANFVIASDSPADTASLRVSDALSVLGRPSATYHVDGSVVMVYSYNLLTKVVIPQLAPGA